MRLCLRRDFAVVCKEVLELYDSTKVEWLLIGRARSNRALLLVLNWSFLLVMKCLSRKRRVL